MALTSLDDEGIPVQASVGDWLDLVPGLDSRGFQALLRFSRADGSPVFGPIGPDPARLRRMDARAAQLADPSLAAVMARWLPRGQSATLVSSIPPLPSTTRPDRTLAVLRPDWSPRGDLLAVDHRQPGSVALIEVAAKGVVWLGPTWTTGLVEGKQSPAKPTSWTSTPLAQSLEWSFSIGKVQILRSLTWIRGRSLALMTEESKGGSPEAEVRVALADGIEASMDTTSRSVVLGAGSGKPSARLVPLRLPCHVGPTDRGSLAIEGREIVIRQPRSAGKTWMAWLLAWDRPPTFWRELTVAQRSKVEKPGQSFAARVAWGSRQPGLVIYRSLGKPVLRSFLGHQTSARFLVGQFSTTGEVSSILKLDA